MNYTKKFRVKPGSKINLDKIDAGFKDKIVSLWCQRDSQRGQGESEEEVSNLTRRDFG